MKLFILVCCAVFGLSAVGAQDNQLAAVLEVLDGGVEVQRVATDQWIAVRVEAIVGVGDHIRTDASGRARITFFADGIESEVQPSSEVTITEFSGTAETFDLTLGVLVGQTTQRIERALDASTSYQIETPSMSLAARGTEFQVRVETSGRAAAIVSEGLVAAGQDGESADVPPSFGVRAEEEGLSDVVLARTFDELDAALDGCPIAITTTDDVSLNIRLAPSTDAPRVGVVAASDVTNVIGITQNGDWYRIGYRDGFGWILSSSAIVGTPCAGLRQFPDDQGAEDASLFSSLGDEIDLNAITAEVAPEATTTPGG